MIVHQARLAKGRGFNPAALKLQILKAICFRYEISFGYKGFAQLECSHPAAGGHGT
jgi:hypothetical protein